MKDISISKGPFSIVFVGPINGIKPYIVLSSLINFVGINWEKSWVVTESLSKKSNFQSVINSNKLNHFMVTDLSLKNDVSHLYEFSPDFLISCGWGAKISSEVLKIPKIAALNCHGSFLPDYKGGSVYLHYWANCEEWMGATVHYITENFDEGNIITQEKLRVFANDTPIRMLWRMSELTSSLLREAIFLSSIGYKGTPQSGGRYFYKISGRKLKVYRCYNRFAVYLGLTKRLTPHKVII